ncbi:helix-turn-helix domain-containing protein [Capnocytophaga canis]|uniref:AAA ATPase n=1 Tax=Capnocytophaga canis TaxID=1848903 RepID=A0A0B7IJ01_9FLAO|nr:helix-turn-helix domain-containing protein [Capnocytophaga canis]CEN51870.1 AAA ATPase [Capnocytophaga canis]
MEELILTLINQTSQNIFLTGKAGTGKTTLLHKIIKTTHKNTIVVAPTGIAALNAGGVTIHSMFQLPFASFLPTLSNPPVVYANSRFENRMTLRKHFKMRRNKQQLFHHLELLVIDEVSMLRADVLDAMDFMLQNIRKDKRPFGGVQVLFIGDLLQLPPVVKNEEWEVLKTYYSGIFFFQSKVITENPLLYVELDKIYRQSDDDFISILNNLRDNKLNFSNMELLQGYVNPNFRSDRRNEYITLTTHNAKADAINNHEMRELHSKEYMFEAEIVGDFPEYMYPIDKYIYLKEGARVMFIKNDLSPEKLFFNGKMGTVMRLSDGEIEVLLDGGKTINVEKHEWENIRYQINEQTKEIEEERLGTFSQYPLRLAWAITVHKSQGLTFEKAILDLDHVFAPGQLYVAFSRLRSMEGMVLLSQVSKYGIENSEEVVQYAVNKASPEQLSQACVSGEKAYLENAVLQCFQWDNLLGNWNLHKGSYVGDMGNKNLYKDWALEQMNQVVEMVILTEKFTKQLKHILHTDYDFNFLYERFEKAYLYFFPRLETLWYEVLRVQKEIETHKKVKQFREELIDLESVTSEVIRSLFKTRQMMQLAKNQQPFNNSSINLSPLVRIRENLILKAKEQLKEKRLFVEEQSHQATKIATKEKESTYDITYQLWEEMRSVEAIAEKRMFTTATIYRHLMKLMEMDKVQISELLSEQALNELTTVFEQEEDLSLGYIYDLLNERYTWDELRLFKSYFLKNMSSE